MWVEQSKLWVKWMKLEVSEQTVKMGISDLPTRKNRVLWG